MNESMLAVMVDIAGYLERIAEALEAIEDNMRAQHEAEGADS